MSYIKVISHTIYVCAELVLQLVLELVLRLVLQLVLQLVLPERERALYDLYYVPTICCT